MPARRGESMREAGSRRSTGLRAAWQRAESPESGGGPRTIADVLSQLQSLRGHGRVQGARQLAELWQRIAGIEISGRTKVIGLKNGTLQIGVPSAALLGELTSFHQHRLLEKLRGDPECQR